MTCSLSWTSYVDYVSCLLKHSCSYLVFCVERKVDSIVYSVAEKINSQFVIHCNAL